MRPPVCYNPSAQYLASHGRGGTSAPEINNLTRLKHLMPYTPTLHSLRLTLASLQAKEIGVQECCREWRSQEALLTALPPKFGRVLEDLLARLEAGSLFSEESCSFSQEDLLQSLGIWLDKAEEKLKV